jgi:hypothetical protein
MTLYMGRSKVSRLTAEDPLAGFIGEESKEYTNQILDVVGSHFSLTREDRKILYPHIDRIVAQIMKDYFG